MTVRGFTPVFDDIAEKHGEVCALVYGRVWRYAQHPSGLCTASQKTMADRLGLDRSTVNKYLQLLIEHKDIIDFDEGVRNRPHRLKTAKTWSFNIFAEGVDEDNTSDVSGVDETDIDVDETDIDVDETDKKIAVKDTQLKDSILKSIAAEFGQDVANALEIIAGIDKRVVLEFPVSASLLVRARAKIAIDNNAARQEAGELDVSWLPEYLRPLGAAFIEAWQEPFETERAFWIEGLISLYERQIPPELVKPVIAKMMQDGTTIKSPGSIVTNAQSMKMQARYAKEQTAAPSTQRAAVIVE